MKNFTAARLQDYAIDNAASISEMLSRNADIDRWFFSLLRNFLWSFCKTFDE